MPYIIKTMCFYYFPGHGHRALQDSKRNNSLWFLYQIHHDPMHYNDPKTFNPSRFIDESGHFFKDEQVIPFSIGKRFCLGQTLAEQEFFIFFTALMQQFEFLPDPQTPLPTYKDIYPKSLIRNVPAYKVILKKRF